MGMALPEPGFAPGGGEAEGKAVGFISLFFLPHSLCDMQGLLESEVQ